MESPLKKVLYPQPVWKVYGDLPRITFQVSGGSFSSQLLRYFWITPEKYRGDASHAKLVNIGEVANPERNVKRNDEGKKRKFSLPGFSLRIQSNSQQDFGTYLIPKS